MFLEIVHGLITGITLVILFRSYREHERQLKLMREKLAEATADLETLCDPEMGIPSARQIIRRRRITPKTS